MLLASAAALGVGLIALPASAAAAPPAIPTCAFPNTAGSDSCDTIVTTGSPNPIGTAFENINMGVRVRSAVQPGDQRDDQREPEVRPGHQVQPGSCPGPAPPPTLSGKTIQQAYNNAARPTASGAATPSCRRPGNVSGVGVDHGQRGSTPAR